MNERIKLLAERAGYHPDVYELCKPGMEKFAELIIQDCIDIISPYTVKMSRPGEEYLHPISEIQKHFGVKE